MKINKKIAMGIIAKLSLYSFAIILLLSACNDAFLAQEPEKKDGVKISRLEHLEMLISTFTEHQAFSKENSIFELISSDAFEMPANIAMQPFISQVMSPQVHKYYV